MVHILIILVSRLCQKKVVSNCDHFSKVVTMASVTEVFVTRGDDLKNGSLRIIVTNITTFSDNFGFTESIFLVVQGSY